MTICIFHSSTVLNNNHQTLSLRRFLSSPNVHHHLIDNIHRPNNQVPIPIRRLKARTRLIRARAPINHLQHRIGNVPAVRRLVVARVALREDLRLARVAHLHDGVARPADGAGRRAQRVEVVVARNNVVDVCVGAVVGPAFEAEERRVDVGAGCDGWGGG